jgi:hypothetical protein
LGERVSSALRLSCTSPGLAPLEQRTTASHRRGAGRRLPFSPDAPAFGNGWPLPGMASGLRSCRCRARRAVAVAGSMEGSLQAMGS